MVMLVFALILWTELPAWKREAYWRKITGYRPVMPAMPDWQVEREIADFMRKVARWEHESRGNNQESS